MQTLFTIGFWIFIFIILLALFRVLQLVYISTQGAFYATSNDDRIKNLIRLAKIKNGEKVVDLGCGDGRVVIALAKAGAKVDGVEIDPYYYLKAKKNVEKANLNDKAKILKRNFWNMNLSEYDVIVVYGISYIMRKLEKKLQREMKSDARVISVYYRFPTWKEEEREGEVWLYRKG